MAEISETFRKEYEHERDDFLDDFVKYEEAMLKGEGAKISTQWERMECHLRRIEETRRLAGLLGDC